MEHSSMDDHVAPPSDKGTQDTKPPLLEKLLPKPGEAPPLPKDFNKGITDNKGVVQLPKFDIPEKNIADHHVRTEDEFGDDDPKEPLINSPLEKPIPNKAEERNQDKKMKMFNAALFGGIAKPQTTADWLKHIDELKKADKPDTEAIAYSLDVLGTMLRKEGNFAQARDCYAQSSEAYKQAFGPDDLSTIQTAMEVARMDKELGNWGRAESEYQNVVDSYRRFSLNTDGDIRSADPATARRFDLAGQKAAHREYAEVLDHLGKRDLAEKHRLWTRRPQ